MATAPEVVSQEADEEIDELTAALEGTQEKDETGEGKEDEVTGETDETGEEETEGEGKETTAGEGETEKAEVDPKAVEIRDLRTILREQKKEMALLKAQTDRASKRATAALDEDDEALQDDLSPVEQLSAAIQQVGQERGAQLDLLAETMSEMNKYSDIYDVCSKENFNDMFDAIGKGIAQERGISVDEAVLQAELTIWNQPNPYKYMYNLIKEHHPAYTEKEPTESKAPKPGDTEKTGKDKKPVEAPASIAGMVGGETNKSGWTAARIDALPEDELDKVPADIYSKYLKNQLK